jgi:hypothetical protein
MFSHVVNESREEMPQTSPVSPGEISLQGELNRERELGLDRRETG